MIPYKDECRVRLPEWMEATPPPEVDVILSLPANLTTAMVLVDYAAHGLATPTPWPQVVVRSLARPALGSLERLRAVLAHGTVLREFILDRLPADHAAQRDWHALRAWLQAMDAATLTDLVIAGILAGLEYYRTEMDPMPAVEALLEHIGGRSLNGTQLRHRKARRLALEALLASWSVRDVDEPLGTAMDPERLRSDLLMFFDALWEAGFGAEWHAALPQMESAVAAARAAHAAGRRAAPELILAVTGLQPPADLDGALRSARRLEFAPCLHLGNYLSITRPGYGWTPPGEAAAVLRVFYEPSGGTGARWEGIANGSAADTRGPGERAAGAGATGAQVLDLGNLVPALEALGDATRVAMLQLLRRGGEMFAGEIANALRLHPSTVSRHVAQLEAAGLVRSRREGQVKYYRLDHDRLRTVARVLERELGEPPRS